MENRGEVRAWKSGARLRFRMTRRVRPMDAQALADTWGQTWLRQAGYQEETYLEATGVGPAAIWLWNLTQVRAPSQVRIPLSASGRETERARHPSVTAVPAEGCAVIDFRGDRPFRIGLSGADVGDRREGGPGGRILCLEEREAGRAQLLVKDFEKVETGGRPGPLVECRWAGGENPGELSCASPSLPASGKRRILWKTSLCAFSGRSEEIRAFAAKLGAGG
jgi:hypothetical protein